MRYQSLAVAIAAVVCGATAELNQVTIWSSTGCAGNSDFLYTDVSQDFCFEGAQGASFNAFGSECGQGGGKIRTWSGGNCEGSSQEFDFPEGCIDIPFGSVELFCF